MHSMMSFGGALQSLNAFYLIVNSFHDGTIKNERCNFQWADYKYL